MLLKDVFLDVLAGSGEADLRFVFRDDSGTKTYTATFFQAGTRKETGDKLAILAYELLADEEADS